MTSPLRVLDTGVSGARWNVAVTAALAELHARGQISDTLRLHRYRKSVLLGRSQSLDTALDRAACARRGAEIARRITGGGAVAMAPGVLAWDLVAARDQWTSLDAAAAGLCGALVAALGRFGVAARFEPPGNVTVAGRKIAGTSGAFDGGTVVHQGSLLVAADLTEMAELLRLSELPVATLADFVRPLPAMPDIAQAVATAFASALGRPGARDEPISAAELDLAAELLAEELGTAAFVEGEAAEADAGR